MQRPDPKEVPVAEHRIPAPLAIQRLEQVRRQLVVAGRIRDGRPPRRAGEAFVVVARTGAFASR